MSVKKVRKSVSIWQS